MSKRADTFYKQRRIFLKYLGLLPVALWACDRPTGNLGARVVELGPADNFPDGLTVDRVKRLAILRNGDNFSVLPMVCTHQACALNYENQEFVCPCHGARFSIAGEVLQGPATKKLNWLKADRSPEGSLRFERAL